MRKVTRDIVAAYLAGMPRSISNSHTDGQRLFLHGNLIAEKVEGGHNLTLAGWPTPTTRERLNGLLSALMSPEAFYQRDHRQFFGGEWMGGSESREIDAGETIFVPVLTREPAEETEES